MNKGAIEVHVVYHEHLGEVPHRQWIPIDMIATINECPVTHGAAPFNLRMMTNNDTVAVILVKQLEAFTQTFTVETYEEVKRRAIAAGLNIVDGDPETRDKMREVGFDPAEEGYLEREREARDASAE